MPADPATANLLDALHFLYRVIASRHQALVEINRSLEQRAANRQLTVEHGELKTALDTVKATQQRLFESERKRSLESKRYMDLLLAQVVDGDPAPTLVINAEHKVTHWNKACAAITGVPATDIIVTNRQWSAFNPLGGRRRESRRF